MFKAKRNLTNEELDKYLNLKTDQQKKKYLESLQEQLWENLDQKKK